MVAQTKDYCLIFALWIIIIIVAVASSVSAYSFSSQSSCSCTAFFGKPALAVTRSSSILLPHKIATFRSFGQQGSQHDYHLATTRISSRSGKSSSTSIKYKNTDYGCEVDEQQSAESVVIEASTVSALSPSADDPTQPPFSHIRPSTMDLPRSVMVQEHLKNSQWSEHVFHVEIIVGRVAMVGALIMFLVEAATGMSFLEQIIASLGHF